MSNPLVSIVIPTFNRSALLNEAVESVLAQTYRPIELVIVDDGSTDDTLAMLYRSRSRITEAGVILSVQVNEENIGAGASLDVGFNCAEGEFISYLGSDDLLVDPDKTTNQVQRMVDTGSDWSYFRGMMIGTTPSNAKMHLPSFVPGLVMFNPTIERKPRLRLLFLLWRNPINSSSLMVRCSVYHKHGGWEAWTKNADCDSLLLLNYSYLRLKCTVLDGAPLFYRVHEGQVSTNHNAMTKGKDATRLHTLQLLKLMNEPIPYRILARFFRSLTTEPTKSAIGCILNIMRRG